MLDYYVHILYLRLCLLIVNELKCCRFNHEHIVTLSKSFFRAL